MDRKNNSFLIGLLFLIVSCAKSDSSNQISFDSQDTGILNGKQVTSSDVAAKSVVKVFAKGTPQEPREGTVCTGTLVEKRFVVTAAHCLLTDDGTPYIHIKVSFGSTTVLGKTFLTHPLFNKVDQASYDVGLILLESEAPSDARPAIIPLSYVDVKALSLYVAGFGDTEKDHNRDKKLNWAPVNLLSDSELKKAKEKERMLEVNSKEARTFVISQPRAESTGISHGDSGGPLFYLQDSEMVLLGVISSVSTSALGKANAYSVPYLRRFFAKAFHQLRKLGQLDGKASIPAWERMESLSTDSQNIELWRRPTKLPFKLKLVNESYSFKKARLVSATSASLKTYSGKDVELQLSTDDKFNCTSDSLTASSSPLIALVLDSWPKTEMIEREGYFFVLKGNRFQQETVRAQLFEIKEGRAKFNIMNAQNPVVSVDIEVLDCRDQ